ncbi:hypothetical protein SISNIDRAFT_458346 [Sistotremastrum niveocremeum HHB9708]|uniref:Uncharacterized protein n=1 Tax=Sistotremastrum niveocremeum HHB9708 TaxID=1314777 RepID=A0A164QVR9_9AGAM|nr:hypothetical protein SISNIDRAFT_458346 [Sistotremastrum niveocremeum HHB9708]
MRCLTEWHVESSTTTQDPENCLSAIVKAQLPPFAFMRSDDRELTLKLPETSFGYTILLH